MLWFYGKERLLRVSDEISEYNASGLSAFQLKRVIRAMAQKYDVPISAYLGNVFISSECAVGVVFGQGNPGASELHVTGYIFQTMPIFELRKVGRFWVASTNCGEYVLTSFEPTSGRAELKAMLATADEPEAHQAS